MGQEILTFQFGPYANLTGTHFWTTQDRIMDIEDHSDDINLPRLDRTIFHRLNYNKQGNEKDYPRVLSFDRSRNMVSSGQTTRRIQQRPYETCIRKSQADLFSHRSSSIIPGMWVESAEFLGFGEGLTIASKSEYQNQWEEKIRFFVEECDRIQGFVSLVDVLSGFSGVAACLMEHLHDQYPGIPIVSVGLRRPVPVRDFTCQAEGLLNLDQSEKLSQDRVYALNESLLNTYVSEYASFHLPVECMDGLRLRSVVWDSQNEYHSSAMLASLLDTLMLPMQVFSGDLNQSSLKDIHSLCQTALGHRESGHFCHIAAAVENLVCEAQPANGSFASFNRGIVHEDFGMVSECAIVRRSRPLPSNHGVSTMLSPPCSTKMAETFSSGLTKCPKKIVVIPKPIPLKFPTEMLSTKHLQNTRPDLSMLIRFGCSRSFADGIARNKKSLRNIADSGEGKAILHMWEIHEQDLALAVERLAEFEDRILTL